MVRGGHSEVAGGNTKVLMRDLGSRLLPSPCGGRGCSRKRFSLGWRAGVPESAYCQENPFPPPPRPLTMACEPHFVLGLGEEGLDGHGFWEGGVSKETWG